MTSQRDRSLVHSIDPTTNEIVASYRTHDTTEIAAIVADVSRAQASWRRVPIDLRAGGVASLGEALRRRRQPIAEMVTTEMGKPIAQAESEIDKSVGACAFYAEEGSAFLARERVTTAFDDAYVRFDPLGVVLAVMPWNFPIWQVVRLLAPALLAGNGVVLKHASSVTGCSLAIEALVEAAGLPAGLIRSVVSRSDAVSGIIADEHVAAVCFTGSTPVGAEIASEAGRHLKKQVLELGGSDPFIVLADAEVETAATAAVAARFSNAGQSCVAAKRFIVADALMDEFVDAMVARTAALRVGDPKDRTSDVGPLARPDLRDSLVGQVEASVGLGARIVTGGKVRPGPGNYYEPTIMTSLTLDMPVVVEETFGPVAAVIGAADDDAAVALANATDFGLGASVWTSDVERAERLVDRLDVGTVFMNSRVSSDPRLPFGGVKHSGYGRELGVFGIRELTNIKAVTITH